MAKTKKDQELHFRATTKDVELLESLSYKLDKSKSDIVRMALSAYSYVVNQVTEDK